MQRRKADKARKAYRGLSVFFVVALVLYTLTRAIA